MELEPTTAPTAGESLQPARVYTLAALSLAVGLFAGYLLPVPQSTVASKPPVASTTPKSPHGGAVTGHMPSLEDLKVMADKQAQPLLDKLKTDPRNGALLVQVGAIYHSTHQFKAAAVYYQRAVEAEPKNVAYRTKLATSLFRSNDVDGAIQQLNQGLAIDPKDANSLFNLGVIRLQGKQDAKGAIQAWRQLLKSNPTLAADRRAAVEKMIADAQAEQKKPHSTQGAESK